MKTIIYTVGFITLDPTTQQTVLGCLLVKVGEGISDELMESLVMGKLVEQGYAQDIKDSPIKIVKTEVTEEDLTDFGYKKVNNEN